MHGLIQDVPLTTSATLAHAAHVYPANEILTAREGTVVHRTTYAEADSRARRLASSLSALGLTGNLTRTGSDEGAPFIGALAFNTWRLFEVMHAVPGTGCILHTANPRLHERHLAYTVTHAGDRAMLVDLDCLPLAERIAPCCSSVAHWIVLCSRAELPRSSLPNALCYEELIESGDPNYVWPRLDERQASTLCFTSATTGEPKGVLYSHRGTVINVLTIAGANGWNLGRNDCALAAAPFFHCNGWGLPYMAPMTGAKLVLPGRTLSAEAMLSLIRSEGVTHTGGVPTLLMDLLAAADADQRGFGGLRVLWTGGTAPPARLVERLEERGPVVMHAFGMTETTQALTVAVPREDASAGERRAEQLTQGQPIFLSEIRAVDDTGARLPNDGEHVGHIQVHGPAVASGYFRRPDLKPVTTDGWLDTGDIGTVGPEGHLKLTDRHKDAIKSGGEWISSVALENAAAGCPGVAEAACVGVEHPRWQERPLLLVVRDTSPHPVEASSIRAHLLPQIARWWMPDAIIFVEQLPRNGVGKVMKAELRDRYQSILLGDEQAGAPDGSAE